MSYRTIAEIEGANRAYAAAHGQESFFAPVSLRLADTRVHGTVYGGRLFITSDQYVASEHANAQGSRADPRRFSIRICDVDGSIATVGEFRGYATFDAAERAAKWLADED
jgi:hypothetical protein